MRHSQSRRLWKPELRATMHKPYQSCRRSLSLTYRTIFGICNNHVIISCTPAASINADFSQNIWEERVGFFVMTTPQFLRQFESRRQKTNKNFPLYDVPTAIERSGSVVRHRFYSISTRGLGMTVDIVTDGAHDLVNCLPLGTRHPHQLRMFIAISGWALATMIAKARRREFTRTWSVHHRRSALRRPAWERIRALAITTVRISNSPLFTKIFANHQRPV